MRNVHLSRRGDGSVCLWGGPVAVDADNIHMADDTLVDICTVPLMLLWERDGDDGAFWRRWLLFIGLPVKTVKRGDKGVAHVELENGSWLCLDITEGVGLADEALTLGVWTAPDVAVPKAPTIPQRNYGRLD